MRTPTRAVHLDFHTMPKVPDVGAAFDADEFVAALAGARVDGVTVFARCNLGFAYYPTDVGIPHPGLRRDLLGEMVRACRQRDVLVSAYINVGLSHEEAHRHRDWCVVGRDGRVWGENKLDHFFRQMCLNTGYGEQVRAMIREILDRYDVDGFFLDCMGTPPCSGFECTERMLEAGLNPRDDADAATFAAGTKLAFMAEIRALLGDGKMLYGNGLPYRAQAPHASHIEIECLPTGGWGYDAFPVRVRYCRKLGLPVLGQTGRFQGGWGDFGGLRPQAALDYDCFLTVGHAVQCGVGDHLHPRGRLEPAVIKRIESSYRQLAALEEWTTDARACTDTAIVAGAEFAPDAGPGGDAAITGATRMLEELHCQFDVVDAGMDMSGYRLLVLPDALPVASPLKEKLEQHLADGGAVVSSGQAGMTPDGAGFALDAWAMDVVGPERHNVSFFRPVPAVARDIPDLPLATYKPGIEVRPRAGAEVLAWLWKPYFDRHWDGRHGYVYVPPDRATEYPALVHCGPVLHFSFPVFTAYHEHALQAHRCLLGNALQHMGCEPLLTVLGLPSFGRATVTSRPGADMVHLYCYCPEKRGPLQIVEEALTVRTVEIRLRRPGVDAVMLAPGREPLDFSADGSYTRVIVPEFSGYQMVVFRHGSTAAAG